MEQVGLVDEILVVDDHSHGPHRPGRGRRRRPRGGRRRRPARARARRGQGRGALEVRRRGRGRPHRVVRRRHHATSGPGSSPGSSGPLLAERRRRLREGLLRPARGPGGARRRAGHRAGRPAHDRAAVPAPVVDRAAAGGRVRRPPRRCSSGCRSCRATASTSACSSTSPSSRAPACSPRSTSAPAATATARSTSSARRPSPCCRPRCAGPTPSPAATATLVRPDLEPVEVEVGERPRARRRPRLPPPHRLARPSGPLPSGCLLRCGLLAGPSSPAPSWAGWPTPGRPPPRRCLPARPPPPPSATRPRRAARRARSGATGGPAMIFSTAAAGTASSRPKKPTSVPPASSASITTAGCSFTARCITIGLMKWLSICWTIAITTATAMACDSPPPVVRAMMMPGTAPTHGPISGIMLNSPATMPTISQNGRSMMQHADRGHHADHERHRELAAEVAADGPAEPAGHDHHVAPGALGDQAAEHHPDVRAGRRAGRRR